MSINLKHACSILLCFHEVVVVVVVSHNISSVVVSGACGHKTRGSEGALEERQGPHQRVTNHKCRAPQGALLRRTTLVETK